MKRFHILFFLAAAVLLVMGGAVHAPLEAETRANEVRISGSSTIKPVVMVAARILGKRHNVEFNVSGRSSSEGVQDVTENAAELGMADRYLEPMEIISYPDLKYYTIGFDGIAIIVNTKNPVKSLSKSEVKRLFGGAVRNWKEVGGTDMEVTLVSMEMGDSSQVVFSRYFGLNVLPLSSGFRFIGTDLGGSGGTPQLARRNSEAIMKVGETPGAIGYMSMGAALRAQSKLGTIKPIELDGVAATRENVKTKTYPIVRPLNIVSLGEPEGNVKVFIDYLLSGYGQNIVKNLDYTPIR